MNTTSKPEQGTTLDAAQLRELAVEAKSDPRSVAKEIRFPRSVKGLAGHRIREVLRRRMLVTREADE